MAAAKKEYLENKQREFRFSIFEGFTTNSSVVWIGRNSRTKRRATGGHQDGLCLQNHLLLERMTGGLQETFGKKISRDLLKSFKPPRWTGFEIPTPLDEFFLVLEVVKGVEKNFIEWDWFRRTGPLMFNTIVAYTVQQSNVWGQSRIMSLVLNDLRRIICQDPSKKISFHNCMWTFYSSKR